MVCLAGLWTRAGLDHWCGDWDSRVKCWGQESRKTRGREGMRPNMPRDMRFRLGPSTDYT